MPGVLVNITYLDLGNCTTFFLKRNCLSRARLSSWKPNEDPPLSASYRLQVTTERKGPPEPPGLLWYIWNFSDLRKILLKNIEVRISRQSSAFSWQLEIIRRDFTFFWRSWHCLPTPRIILLLPRPVIKNNILLDIPLLELCILR